MGDRDQLLNDVEAAQRLILDGRQATIWTALPGIVKKVNYSAYTCEVQPAIQGTVQNEDGSSKSVNLPLLVDVPIVFPHAGGFSITFPLKVGDEVLVIFSSRCIDSWWQSGGIQRPMEARMHDLSDAFAVPGPWSQAKVGTPFSNNSLQIKNDLGNATIEIDADGTIRLVSSTGIETTNLHVNGNIVATGEVTASGKALSTHLHSGVTSGGADTGPPV